MSDASAAVDAYDAALAARDLVGMERGALEAGGDLAQSLRFSRRRGLLPAVYADLVAWVMHMRIGRGLSNNTCSNYVDGVAEFAAWLAGRDVQIAAVAAKHLEDWQQSLYLERGLSPESRLLKVTAVRRFYEWREQLGLGVSPVRSVRGPRRAERVPRKFTDSQVVRMLECWDRETTIGRRNYAMLRLFLHAGPRRSEVAGLRIPQLELRERVGAVRFFGKGAKERVVAFEGPVVPALQLWLAERETLGLDHDRVFISMAGPNGKGAPLTGEGVLSMVRTSIDRAGLRGKIEDGMAVHTLRATFATALYDDGKELEQIRLILGHSDINTTRKYIAISDRQRRARLSGDRWGGGKGMPLWAKAKLGMLGGDDGGEGNGEE